MLIMNWLIGLVGMPSDAIIVYAQLLWRWRSINLGYRHPPLMSTKTRLVSQQPLHQIPKAKRADIYSHAKKP